MASLLHRGGCPELMGLTSHNAHPAPAMQQCHRVHSTFICDGRCTAIPSPLHCHCTAWQGQGLVMTCTEPPMPDTQLVLSMVSLEAGSTGTKEIRDGVSVRVLIYSKVYLRDWLTQSWVLASPKSVDFGQQAGNPGGVSRTLLRKNAFSPENLTVLT